ncbi:MAG: putative bifunctional diguanylate cyclase/phosphodiesterase [Gammaproteobacteria bacterium]
MALDIKLKMRGIYVLVLALGALLSVLIYSFGDDMLHASRKLVRQDLPLLEDIAQLKVEVMEHESLLHEYYASGDRERFLLEQDANAADYEQAYKRLSRGFGQAPELERVQGYYARMRDIAAELDSTLTQQPADGEHAQALLAHLSGIVRSLNTELDTLMQLIEARVLESAGSAEATIATISRLVLLYTIAIFLVAVIVGYSVNGYLYANAERRRLAVFPERNPNPVMRLALDGTLLYANPAAAELLGKIGLDPNDALKLLPPDLRQRLKALRANGRGYDVWQYQVDTRLLECGIHYIPDLTIYHAYVTDITERRRTEERLVFQAYHNALTELPNRRMFEEVMEQTLPPPGPGARQAALLLLSVDRLKVVTETFGHVIGDQLLQAIAVRLKTILDHCREGCHNATLYHFDGELYAVLLPDLVSAQAPAMVAEKVLEAMKEPLYVAGRELFASVSIGVAVFPDDGRDAVTLLRNAESAMQRVKKTGGRGFQLYEPEMNAMAAQWMALENYLRHALEHGELAVYYQPQFDVKSGRATGVEALLRWSHPTRGLLLPGEFIPLAEETGMIVGLGEWVLHQACAQQRAWCEQGLMVGTMAVNMSAGQFHQQDLPALVARVLQQTRLPAQYLELEITETVAMQDAARSTATLHELKNMGVRLAIDDFGTGFSSLSYLKRFPIDRLKIDRSFVRGLTTDANDLAITRAVITLGHSLKQRVLAEGVETRDQLARLRQLDCDEAQGNLYAPPLPAAEVEQLLRSQPRLVERV